RRSCPDAPSGGVSAPPVGSRGTTWPPPTRTLLCASPPGRPCTRRPVVHDAERTSGSDEAARTDRAGRAPGGGALRVGPDAAGERARPAGGRVPRRGRARVRWAAGLRAAPRRRRRAHRADAGAAQGAAAAARLAHTAG